jgi:predicted amidohydrolase
MKICIAQTQSEKGNIQKNIKNHLRFIERAVKYKADLIIFPEFIHNQLRTSISQSTGYKS